jgi:diaminopimelate decarboxylase
MNGRMHGFERRRGEIHCENVPLRDVAAQTGTPVFVYAAGLIRARYRELDEAFAGYPHRLHYAIKANATLGIVRLMRALGAGADANSGGELEVALRAGYTAPEVVFTGVGKTGAELERAIGLGVAAINAESPGEMDRIAAIAAAQGVRANVAVRVNPDIDAGSHPHISTGHRATKFGMSMADAAALIREMASRPALRVVGLHVHIGSQITRPEPLERAACAVADLARQLMADRIELQHLDVGGGLGIAYEPGQTVVDVRDYASAVLRAVRPTGLTLLLEPGRWLVAPAGVLVTEVVDTKAQGADGRFVVVDAGMTELLRPALYGAYHHIEPADDIAGAPIRTDVVGPVCETSDTLGRDRQLPPVDVGDLLVVRDTGAYGSVMASNYNRRLAAAEVLVDENGWRLIRRRQTIDDLLQWDT